MNFPVHWTRFEEIRPPHAHRTIQNHIEPYTLTPIYPYIHISNAVGGNPKKNHPSSPTKAEVAHDRHVNRSGVSGDPKKHGNGGKGTWGSVQDDIKEAIAAEKH